MSDAAIPDLAEVLFRLGEHDAFMPDESLEWARGENDWKRALAERPQRDWLFWLAGALMRHGHLRAETLATTACACARHVLHFVPASEDRPRLALEAAEQWARGEVPRERTMSPRDASYDSLATCWGRANDAARAAHWAASVAAGGISPRVAAMASAWASAEASDGTAVDEIVKRELVPALLEGLIAYETSRRPAEERR